MQCRSASALPGRPGRRRPSSVLLGGKCRRVVAWLLRGTQCGGAPMRAVSPSACQTQAPAKTKRRCRGNCKLLIIRLGYEKGEEINIGRGMCGVPDCRDCRRSGGGGRRRQDAIRAKLRRMSRRRRQGGGSAERRPQE